MPKMPIAIANDIPGAGTTIARTINATNGRPIHLVFPARLSNPAITGSPTTTHQNTRPSVQ